MNEDKIKFVEEIKVKRESFKKNFDSRFLASTNPVKANLMKFIHNKEKFNLKDLP